jgi:hypothetical protein
MLVRSVASILADLSLRIRTRNVANDMSRVQKNAGHRGCRANTADKLILAVACKAASNDGDHRLATSDATSRYHFVHTHLGKIILLKHRIRAIERSFDKGTRTQHLHSPSSREAGGRSGASHEGWANRLEGKLDGQRDGDIGAAMNLRSLANGPVRRIRAVCPVCPNRAVRICYGANSINRACAVRTNYASCCVCGCVAH